MPSPFPGMDPYLEAPQIWPGFHQALALEIRGYLNHRLPSPYYADIQMRPEIGILDDEDVVGHRIPDVAVAKMAEASVSTGTAVLESPNTGIVKGIEVIVPIDKYRHHYVEIRNANERHKLISLIEIVSPSNKKPGRDRRAYVEKQEEVLNSDASLIEIDLLRKGKRILSDPHLEKAVEEMEPEPDYLVLVNRSWRREGSKMAYEVIPIQVTDSLPCIPVPLKKDIPEVPLELQFVFDQAYDDGPYLKGRINYQKPPRPPLAKDRVAWAGESIQRFFQKT